MTRSFKPKNSKGFTLIELVVYLAILIIVLTVISVSFLWANQSFKKVKAQREVLSNNRRAIEIMSYEIREAKSVYTPTASSTQVSLETTNHLPADETLTYIDFFICDSRICFKKESQPPIAITSEQVEVEKLNFNFLATSTPAIQISLRTKYKSTSTDPFLRASLNSTSTVSLRNY